MLRGEHKDAFLKAERTELDGLDSMGTFEYIHYTDLPKNGGVRIKILPTHWRYAVKPDRLKARLVINGSRESKTDYDDLFAPVCRAVTFRLLLIVALQKGWDVRQADVKQAFVNAKVEDNVHVYARCAPGYDRPGMLMRLRRYAYGLRVSPLKWTQHFARWMLGKGEIDKSVLIGQMNFTQSKVDECLFTNGRMYVCVYCDDILYTGPPADVEQFLLALQQGFAIHDLGAAGTYTGIQIDRTENTVSLHSRDYIKKILDRFGMTDVTPARTPMDLKLKLRVVQGACKDKHMHSSYRSKVGALMYLATTTMPQIAYVVKELSRHLQHPTPQHMQACDRVLAYVKYCLITNQYKITYSKDGSDLIAACDASWGDIYETAKSTSGVMFMYKGAALVWYSQTQRCVTHSSTESELVALDATVREFEYLKKIMLEFKLKVPAPVTVLEDNKSCIRLTEKTTDHQRTKHIRIRYHYVRELVKEGLVRMQHQHTDQQPADLLTKQLGEYKQQLFTQYVLGMKRLPMTDRTKRQI